MGQEVFRFIEQKYKKSVEKFKMTEVMVFLSQHNQKSKFMNMRKRVYDVLNIFISLKVLKKAANWFHILPRKERGGLFQSPNAGKGKSFLSPKEEQFFAKVEEMVG